MCRFTDSSLPGDLAYKCVAALDFVIEALGASTNGQTPEYSPDALEGLCLILSEVRETVSLLK